MNHDFIGGFLSRFAPIASPVLAEFGPVGRPVIVGEDGWIYYHPLPGYTL